MIDEIVAIAKEHYVETAQLPLPFNLINHWAGRREEFAKEIIAFTTIQEVIGYAQDPCNSTFDHRHNFQSDLVSSKMAILTKKFPELVFNRFPESSLSRPVSLGISPYNLIADNVIPIIRLTRGESVVVSNILFYHLEAYASCVYRLNPYPRGVVEFGCGYGALARLFHLGGHTPYYLIDFPESLFFAEVFLRANFPDAKFSYVADSHATLTGDFNFIPIPFAPIIKDLPIDIGISQGTFQEMTLDATEYYYNLINQSHISSFYSLNYAESDEPVSIHLDTTFKVKELNWEIVWEELCPAIIMGDTSCKWLEMGLRRKNA